MERDFRNSPKILCVGAASQDVFLRNSNVREKLEIDGSTDLESLKMGAKIDLNRVYFSVGGSAVNTAVGLARNGAQTSIFCAIGDDFAGRNILEILDAENIDTSRVQTIERYNTDYSTFILGENSRTSLSYRGASSKIDGEGFRIDFGEFDWIYVSNLSGRLDLAEDIFRKAKEVNTKIYWNPGRKEFEKPEVVRALAQMADVFQLNKAEAAALVVGENPEELLRRCAAFSKMTILTDGANGIWATDRYRILRAGLYEDVPVRDKTGAGDAFGVGFLAQWSRGANLKQGVVYASANASAVIQNFGALDGVLTEVATLHSMPMMEKEFN